MQVKPNETPQWISQNLHNAVVIVHYALYGEEIYGDGPDFDKKVRVITVSVSRHILEVFADWIVADEYADVLYHYSLIISMSLGIGQTEWQRARSGLQNYAQWVMKENEQWIIDALDDSAFLV